MRWISYHSKRFTYLLSAFELTGGEAALILSNSFDQCVVCSSSSQNEIFISGFMVEKIVIRFTKMIFCCDMDNKTCSHRNTVRKFKSFFYFGQGQNIHNRFLRISYCFIACEIAAEVGFQRTCITDDTTNIVNGLNISEQNFFTKSVVEQ